MIAPEIEPKLTEAQVRAAMLSHIASHCCYGKTAAKNMTIKKMEYLPAYHYELQTFTEKRETSWTYAAIRTGYESMLGNGGLGSGVPPLPWEIFEEPAQAFKDEVRLVQVKYDLYISTNNWQISIWKLKLNSLVTGSKEDDRKERKGLLLQN